MTEKRTTEEILDERLLVKRIWQRSYLDSEESHVQLIREYAAQELSEYKAKLKEAIHETIDDPEGIVDRDFIRAKTVYQLIDKL